MTDEEVEFEPTPTERILAAMVVAVVEPSDCAVFDAGGFVAETPLAPGAWGIGVTEELALEALAECLEDWWA